MSLLDGSRPIVEDHNKCIDEHDLGLLTVQIDRFKKSSNHQRSDIDISVTNGSRGMCLASKLQDVIRNISINVHTYFIGDSISRDSMVSSDEIRSREALPFLWESIY